MVTNLQSEFKDFFDDVENQEKFMKLVRGFSALKYNGLFSPFVSHPVLIFFLELLANICFWVTLAGIIFAGVYIAALPNSGIVVWSEKDSVLFDKLAPNFRLSLYSYALLFLSYYPISWVQSTALTVSYIVLLMAATIKTVHLCCTLVSSEPWKGIFQHLQLMITSKAYRRQAAAYFELGHVFAQPDIHSTAEYKQIKAQLITQWNLMTRKRDTKGHEFKLNFEPVANVEALEDVEKASVKLMESRLSMTSYQLCNQSALQKICMDRFTNLVAFRLAGLQLQRIFSPHYLFMLFSHETQNFASEIRNKWQAYLNDLEFLDKV